MDERVQAIIDYHRAQFRRMWSDTWRLPSVRALLLTLALALGGVYTEWRLDPETVNGWHLVIAAAAPVAAYVVLVALWNLAMAPYRMAMDAAREAEREKAKAVLDASNAAARERLDELNAIQDKGQALRKAALGPDADGDALEREYESWRNDASRLIDAEFPDCRSSFNRVYFGHRDLHPRSQLNRVINLIENHAEGIDRIIAMKVKQDES